MAKMSPPNLPCPAPFHMDFTSSEKVTGQGQVLLTPLRPKFKRVYISTIYKRVSLFGLNLWFKNILINLIFYKKKI